MTYIIPVFILIIVTVGYLKGVSCFESFAKGAKEGTKTIISLVPSLIGLIVAVGVFRKSGMLELIEDLFSPILNKVGISGEIFPLMLIRPISGSASLATLREIIEANGADSFPARAACVLMGSTETIFYTMAIYTNNTKIKRLPGVLPAALLANFIAAIASCALCSFL